MGHRKGQGSAGELTTMVVSGPALRSAPVQRCQSMSEPSLEVSERARAHKGTEGTPAVNQPQPQPSESLPRVNCPLALKHPELPTLPPLVRAEGAPKARLRRASPLVFSPFQGYRTQLEVPPGSRRGYLRGYLFPHPGVPPHDLFTVNPIFYILREPGPGPRRPP